MKDKVNQDKKDKKDHTKDSMFKTSKHPKTLTKLKPTKRDKGI